jgi:cyclophilin family peptidyl-prolyl cis-trans isomerase
VCQRCSTLPGDYPLFGQVTSGMDVLAKIMALGVTDGPPSKPVGITKVTISER